MQISRGRPDRIPPKAVIGALIDFNATLIYCEKPTHGKYDDAARLSGVRRSRNMLRVRPAVRTYGRCRAHENRVDCRGATSHSSAQAARAGAGADAGTRCRYIALSSTRYTRDDANAFQAGRVVHTLS